MLEIHLGYVLLKGMVVGFVIAAPVGPVGLLCIRRSMTEGRMAALGAGLGAAVADTLYGAVAGLGLHFISDFLVHWRVPLTAVGGAMLLVMAVLAWRKPLVASVASTASDTESDIHYGLLGDFTATLLLTLTNPATVLAFMAVFATLGVVDVGASKLSACLLILGVFLGSGLWWLSLSTLAHAASRHLTRSLANDRWLSHLSHASAGLLGLAGVAVLASLLLRLG